MQNQFIHSEFDSPIRKPRRSDDAGDGVVKESNRINRSVSAFLLLLSACSFVAQADDMVIPYSEIAPDYIEEDPQTDIEISVDRYSDPTQEYRDRQFDPVETEIDVDQRFYTEIAVDHMSESMSEMDEADFPTVAPDSFSGGLFDGKTVYRDMGDAYDAEPMIVVLPAADPELALPPPTVVSVDGYASDQSTVIAVDVIRRKVLAKEDKIFELFSAAAKPPPEVKKAEPESKERITLPMPTLKANNLPVIEILTTDQ